MAAFEARFQLRSVLLWSMGGLFFLLAFLAMAVEQIQVGGAAPGVNYNASLAIVRTQLSFSVLGMFAAIAFVAGAITRDQEVRSAEILFSTALRGRDFALGKFLGGLAAAVAVALLTLLGTLIGSFMPWLDVQRVGAFDLSVYAYTLLVVVLPNTLIVCGLFFSVAALSRSIVWSYVAALALLISWALLTNLAEPETLETLGWLDPFGMVPVAVETRYWTAFERNAELPSFSGQLVVSRVLWSTVAVLAASLTAWRFRFNLDARGGKEDAKPTVPAPTAVYVPVEPVSGARLAAFVSQVRIDVRALLISPPFFVMLAFGLFNAVGGMLTGLDGIYGTPNYPTTRQLLEIASGTFSLTLLLVLVYYSGELVHRERELRVRAMIDATPVANGVVVLAKVVALIFVLYCLLATIGLVAVLIQALQGFTRFELSLYLRELFGVQAMDFVILAVLAVVVQVLSPSKFVGMLITIVIFVGTGFLVELGFEHYLIRFETPPAPYSDLNGYGHYALPFLAFSGYWLLVCGLLMVFAHLMYARGTDAPWRARLAIARQRLFQPGTALVAGFGVVVTALVGSWIYYNTNVLNDYQTRDAVQSLQADYESRYRKQNQMPRPSMQDLRLDLDLYPYERRLGVTGRAELINLDAAPIEAQFFNLDPALDVTRLTLNGVPATRRDKALGLAFFEFDEPWVPGEVRYLEWALEWTNPGFRNSRSSSRLVHNGTFIESSDLIPIPGYDTGRELVDPTDRRRYDLPPPQRLPVLGDPYWLNVGPFGASRTNFSASITTAADQIAIAPGYLEADELVSPGRRRFSYRMDKPIWPFASFTSARYAVTEREQDGLLLQVFHHPAHDWNVERKLDAAADALTYFSAAFAPYQHRQFRIIEFPRYQSFAQSFPNTIPYSEDIGFLADLRDPSDIDYVYYVTAHEAAHQWWGHQVAPAYMQGMTFIVESLAQYSALMVMERRYGQDKMRRFLRYELDRYLRGRGGEAIEELPLALVENQQYIHYQKGGIAMYELKVMLGEAAVNRALRAFVDRFGPQASTTGPRFPTTADLIDLFKAEATAAQRERIADLFERITLFDLSVAEASVESHDDGYLVRLEVEAHKRYADGAGEERDAPFDEPVWIGVFPEPSAELSAGAHQNDLPKPLLFEERQLTSGRQTLEFVVCDKPHRVGVDPYAYRIDRNPGDNLKVL
ncbi:MAG: M1 family aminopeptidase [Pseudomonadota bacterium]